jgi:predicted nucleic acid-binding protein
MKVLVDTNVWSIALRKQNRSPERGFIVEELTDLIKNYRVVMIGTIRQEVLSGIQSIDQFETLKNYLRSFPDLTFETNDFEVAAELYNRCRSHGVQGSHIDFLISAVAINRDISVYTLDRDFENYAKYTSLKLHKKS